ncbi:MAG: Fe-S cluster assembly ATPase SufC [Candidatus Thermoplasmatota archaeon]|nr:Fe-S cluster assembly ATPase SufC [Candidatus Thermoplasmatota archaeon]
MNLLKGVKMPSQLDIIDLHAGVEGKEILKGISLPVPQGEIHALMGPNGSGKSTLSYVILGHPKYEVYSGKVLLDGEDVLEMDTDERARKGLFLGFQYPLEIPGVRLSSFLETSLRYLKPGLLNGEDFHDLLRDKSQMLNIEESFLERSVNEGFSGGEKKRAEVLQLALFEPKLAVMDETDSGLDIDSLQVVSSAINAVAERGTGILLVTHYQRILRYVIPDKVHVLMNGRIVRTGGKELALELEEKGYDWLRKVKG